MYINQRLQTTFNEYVQLVKGISCSEFYIYYTESERIKIHNEYLKWRLSKC